MAFRIEYENTAPSSATSNTTQYVRLYQSDPLNQNAEEGTVAISTIAIDDPDGALDIVGFRRLRVYEDSATSSNTLTYNGWVGEKSVIRGPYRTGSSRVWVTSLTDQNAVLGYRVMVGSDNKRPRESDIARLTWLRGTAEMSTVTESEYIDTTGAVLMDAVDYNGQTPQDIVNDCAQQSGKNYFVYSKDGGSIGATPTLGLFYAKADATLYSSPLRLSNLASDIDSAWTFAISEGTELSRDPSRVYSGVYMQYDGGVVYEQSQTTYVNYTKRDAVVPAENVKSRTTNRATRNLADMDVEDDRITTTIYLPGPKLNFIREGMRVQFRATHLPRYSSNYSWLRVVSRSITQTSEVVPGTNNAVYQVQLVLVGSGLEPASICEASGFTLTAAGTYPPNGSATSAGTGNVEYWRPGTPAPYVPTPGFVGGWHFPIYGGGTDYAGDCTENYLRCLVVGDGTITIRTSTYTAPRVLNAYLQHLHSGEPFNDEILTGIATGNTITFQVSTHGGTYCTHWVDVTDDGGTCGNKWGFSGFDWTPA
jgi:hypothetical protein